MGGPLVGLKGPWGCQGGPWEDGEREPLEEPVGTRAPERRELREGPLIGRGTPRPRGGPLGQGRAMAGHGGKEDPRAGQ